VARPSGDLSCDPWPHLGRTIDQVEVATAEWVEWFNHRRIYEYCGDVPPAQTEATHYAHHLTKATAAVSNQKHSGHAGAV
jgi:hypothetical protein